MKRKNIAKINLTTGEVDPDFNMNIDENHLHHITSILLSGTDLYVGGKDFFIGGESKGILVKANALTGNLDETFGITATGSYGNHPEIETLALSGTDLYIAGWFDSINGQSRYRLAKLNTSTGTLDEIFDANIPIDFQLQETGTPQYISAITVFGSNVYVGGGFDTINGENRNSLAKLNSTTGIVDIAFPELDDVLGGYPYVTSLLLSGTDLYVGGQFSIGGIERNGIAKIDLSTDSVDQDFSSSLISNDVADMAVSENDLYVLNLIHGEGDHASFT